MSDRLTNKVAAQWIEMSSHSYSRSGHRQRLQEIDVAMSTSFRDKVVSEIRSKAQEICSRSHISVHLDGDRTMHIHLSAVAGVHKPMLLILRISPAAFYEFAFARDTVTLTEGYTEDNVKCPDLSKANTTSQVTELLLETMRDYVATGGKEIQYSGMPSAVEKK